MKPILEAQGVSRTFQTGGWFGRRDGVRAVDAVDLRIEPRETLAIVGESGCGKSTLGRLLLRLQEPSAGRVLYEGRDLATLGPGELRRLRRDLQLIFQDPFASLNPQMTIGAIVGEPLWLHDLGTATERRSRVAELFARVGLSPEHQDRYPHEFSGGQRQRIGIARALASGPKLIVGDEPVSALDVSIQAQIVNLLGDLKAAFGLTLVIIAHDLAVIRHMSDRVAVMYLGGIVEIAAAEPLFARPLHPYTQALMAAIPRADPRGRAQRRRPHLQGDVPNPAAPPDGCRFHTRCPHARPRCAVERPPIEDAGQGRAVACHFWREIEPPVFAADEAARPGSTRARRLELYEAARAKAATS